MDLGPEKGPGVGREYHGLNSHILDANNGHSFFLSTSIMLFVWKTMNLADNSELLEYSSIPVFPYVYSIPALEYIYVRISP